MTREQVKELLPIIQAYAEGKQIEIKTKEGKSWCTLEENDIQYLDFKKCDFRIKPEPKYRPFKNAEECWAEMLRHQPFGWVRKTMQKGKIQRRFMIVGVEENCIVWVVNGAVLHWEFNKLFEAFYSFADGTPFGVKVEE